MNLLKLFVFLVLTSVIAGCGGNDGKVDNSSTSSVSNSSSSIANCAAAEGTVFIDTACPGWQDPSVFQQNKTDPSIFTEITFGLPGLLVTQEIINSGDPAHNQVWDIQYNSNPDYNALPHFRAPADSDGNDMSDYAAGKLIFDLKVISLSDSSKGLVVSIECGWPCLSSEQAINIDALNQWKTYAISVADLIRDGLKITNVHMGFQILPHWNRQNNVHFQVDNIRWEKGGEPIAEKCFAQHFDEADGIYGVQLNELANPEIHLPWITGIAPVSIINPQWDQVDSSWGYAVFDESENSVLADCAHEGVLSASVLVPVNYVADGKMNIGLYFSDYDGSLHKFTPVSVAALQPDAWNTISVNLSSDEDYGLVNYVGVYFEANSEPENVTGEIKVDNLVIIH